MISYGGKCLKPFWISNSFWQPVPQFTTSIELYDIGQRELSPSGLKPAFDNIFKSCISSPTTLPVCFFIRKTFMIMSPVSTNQVVVTHTRMLITHMQVSHFTNTNETLPPIASPSVLPQAGRAVRLTTSIN